MLNTFVGQSQNCIRLFTYMPTYCIFYFSLPSPLMGHKLQETKELTTIHTLVSIVLAYVRPMEGGVRTPRISEIISGYVSKA